MSKNKEHEPTRQNPARPMAGGDVGLASIEIRPGESDRKSCFFYYLPNELLWKTEFDYPTL